MEALDLERRGALCGPKPIRGGSLMDLAEGGGARGGMMLSGKDLLQVLQTLTSQQTQHTAMHEILRQQKNHVTT